MKLSSDYIIPKYTDVVLCDNSSKRFASYQWYKNNNPVSGATRQFYNDHSGLVGTYSLKVVTTTGKTLYTCSKTLNTPLNTGMQILVYPNPVVVSKVFAVRLIDAGFVDLKGAVMTIYNSMGGSVYMLNKVETINYLSLNNVGIYIGDLITSDGKHYSFKIIVDNK
jgi:hypothetical protein